MGIFDYKRLKEENTALKQEVKGYMDRENDYNILFKQLYTFNGSLLEFATFDRKKLRSAYESSSAVFGIVDKIAKGVREIAPYIELLDSKGEVVQRHWVNEILKMVNDRVSFQSFLYKWATNKLVYGDVWTYCEATLGSKRQIKFMDIVPSDKIIIEKGSWREPLKGIKIEGTGDGTLITMEQVWQSFYPSLDSETFFGFSPLIAAASDVQLIRSGKARQNTSMSNGAVNTLITPKPDQMGLMPKDTEDLDRELNSAKNINKTKYLRNAIEVHKIGGTPVELGVLDSAKDSVTALCFAYGMPVDLYYGQSKYENAREARKTLYESLCVPLAQEFCADFMLYLNRQFKDTIGLRLQVNTDNIDVLKSSTGEVLDNLTKMYSSLNEKRKAYGYPPIEQPYADEPMIPLGLQFGNAAYDINELDTGE